MRKLLFALALILMFAAPASADKKAKTYAVTIDNFTFAPETIAIPAGATVTWTNHDDMVHLVVVPGLKARSPALDTDASFSQKFDRRGAYAYYCGMHPKMTGTVVVK